jgi:predicted MPP superfamily phosphohydrolase
MKQSAGLASRGAVAGAIAAGVAAGAVFISTLERGRVQVDEYTLLVDCALPAGGLTILHLSDLHLRSHGRVQARKLASLRRLAETARYDILAVTGDLIHDMPGLAPALALLDVLRRPGSAPEGLPAYMVPGNHDYCQSSEWGFVETSWHDAGVSAANLPLRIAVTARNLWQFGRKVLRNERVHHPLVYNDMQAIEAALQEHGIRLLVNRAERCEVAGAAGAAVWIAGVDDLMEGKPDVAAALAGVPPDVLLVLLAHNPDAWLDPRTGRAALVLSGHTHGGQIHLPLVGALHTQGTHLSRRHASGWFERDGSRLFVSRGAGESLPLRLGTRPQVALIHLVEL